MKNPAKTVATILACLSLVPAYAQLGGRPGVGMGGPDFSGAMAKIFGDNSAFSATVEMQMQVNDQTMTMPGKLAFDQGKSRFDMDLSEMKGRQMPPEAAAQMKAMGMDKMAAISLPDKKTAYLLYPNMQAYVVMPPRNQDTAKSASDFKIESTELGKDTVDGHPCVKNKVVVTDDKGNPHNYTVWNATDLKKFPIKLETTDGGHQMTMSFKDIKLSKPDASQFDPPSSFKKYDNMGMMMQEMMKRMGGGMPGGMPPRGQ